MGQKYAQHSHYISLQNHHYEEPVLHSRRSFRECFLFDIVRKTHNHTTTQQMKSLVH